ncbi:MAG: hypothetical protein WAL63_19970 [Solirubrobacteraceae bacterium]
MRGASLLGHFRRRYGASPLHLAGHLVVFAIAFFAIDRIASDGGLAELIALYVGFAIAHDLIFLPAYSGLDRLARAAFARLPGRRAARVPAINHIRAPSLISGLLLIIYSPFISRKADNSYFQLSGHHIDGYLGNWLLVSAALFLGSGLIYALRVGRAVVNGPTRK